MFCLFLCVAQMSRHGHTEVSTPSWGAKGQSHVFLPLFKRKKKKERKWKWKWKWKKKNPALPLCFLDLCFALMGRNETRQWDKQSGLLIIRSCCCSELLDLRQLKPPGLIPNNHFCFALFCACIFSSLIWEAKKDPILLRSNTNDRPISN